MGPKTDRGDDDLAADVFARKILDLVHALSAADAAVNGKKAYEYVIARLNSSSPTATCQERVVRWKTPRFDTHSAIGAFSLCAAAIIEGRTEQARRFGKCAEYISRLGIGARKTFEYGELWVSEQQVFRVETASYLSVLLQSLIHQRKSIRNMRKRFSTGFHSDHSTGRFKSRIFAETFRQSNLSLARERSRLIAFADLRILRKLEMRLIVV